MELAPRLIFREYFTNLNTPEYCSEVIRYREVTFYVK